MITHIFDTSALLTHFFDEAGADIAEELLKSYPSTIGVSVLSLPEFRGRLRIELSDTGEIEYACHRYFNLLFRSIGIDRIVAELVEHIRLSASERIPLIDALIAACAKGSNAVLVHKDPHFTVIPATAVSQIYLQE